MKRIWPRPQLNPIPQQIDDLKVCCLSLNGSDWKCIQNAPADFYKQEASTCDWPDITVPSHVYADDNEYAYARILQIPQEWKGSRIFLRFDGANCYARVFVDGIFVLDHYGGFVSWECDITDYVSPGRNHNLIIGMTNKPKEVNSFHQGGLMRDVCMYAVPQTYFARLQVETVFDKDYRDATLCISSRIHGGNGLIAYTLTSPKGEDLSLGTYKSNAEENLVVNFSIASPLKWDSEHPNLYTLTVVLSTDGQYKVAVQKQVGFRQIEIKGNEVFINGDILKLRGINRHDIYPLTGRSITRELVEQDVRLFKEANINFIRTSHYPPRPDVLALCDQYGIYVEDEIAVSFLGFKCNNTENDPAHLPHFMDQFAEMIERDRSHPCVIIWSLANESHWGENFTVMNEYAHSEDPGRPTIFSFPFTMQEDSGTPDIWSVHYGKWSSDLAALSEAHGRSLHQSASLPVLHDESTHIPCYNSQELERDPGVRDFWGETISRFWERLWDTKGALGCAVWAGIDDVKIKDGFPSGHMWGIIDGWRRKKPEYWHIRKAYSPIMLSSSPRAMPGGIVLDIQNRFNHTSLEEIDIAWSLDSITGKIKGPAVAPRDEGILVIPTPYITGSTLTLSFIDPFGFQVDEASFVLGEEEPALPCLCGSAPHLMQMKDGGYQITGKEFSITFSGYTGLITEGKCTDRLVLTSGPILNLTGLSLEPWQLEHMDGRIIDDCAQISLEGHYGKVGVHFTIRVDDTGLMETTYTITNMPYFSPRKVAISGSICSHAGGYDEVGIYFTTAAELNVLSWKRKGLWNVYPDWHIARLNGSTPKNNPQGVNPPDRDPKWEWRLDERDWHAYGKYTLGGKGTIDFRSTKPSILKATLKDDEVGFTALSNGRDAVRMEVTINPDKVISDRNPGIRYHGHWHQITNRYHSQGGTETCSQTAGDFCECTFIGTGIAWLASRDKINGTAKVYIDGVLQDADIDLGIHKLLKNPRGYLKAYGCLVYSAQDLPMGEHTLRIEVNGKQGNDSCECYVNIDHFVVLDGSEAGDIRFIINSEFNYPQLSWGDYEKQPIQVSTGYSKCVYTKIGVCEERIEH